MINTRIKKGLINPAAAKLTDKTKPATDPPRNLSVIGMPGIISIIKKIPKGKTPNSMPSEYLFA